MGSTTFEYQMTKLPKLRRWKCDVLIIGALYFGHCFVFIYLCQMLRLIPQDCLQAGVGDGACLTSEHFPTDS